MVSQHIIDTLYGIASLKGVLPFGLRGWCNELGLFVQMHRTRGTTSLKAGGKFIAKVHAWLDAPGSDTYPSWQVKKYKPGDWESLVDPTYKLTCWVWQQHDLGNPYMVSQLEAAIEEFRRTGCLELPQGYQMYKGATTGDDDA